MLFEKTQIKIYAICFFLKIFLTTFFWKSVQSVLHEIILLFPNFCKFIATFCELIYKVTSTLRGGG